MAGGWVWECQWGWGTRGEGYGVYGGLELGGVGRVGGVVLKVIALRNN